MAIADKSFLLYVIVEFVNQSAT